MIERYSEKPQTVLLARNIPDGTLVHGELGVTHKTDVADFLGSFGDPVTRRLNGKVLELVPAGSVDLRWISEGRDITSSHPFYKEVNVLVERVSPKETS